MASSLKKTVLKKIFNAARRKGENLSPNIQNVMQRMYIPKAKNDLLQLIVPIYKLNSLNPEKLLSSLESDDTIENVRLINTKEAVFSINRKEFISSVIHKCIFKEDIRGVEENLCQKSKVVIEFSSPNIAKPFHLGHLRSTILGNFLGNIYEFVGHDVTRINYLGDWGTQFGLLSLGLKFENVSDEYLGKDPINILYSAYVSANKRASQDSSITDKAREIFHNLEIGASGRSDSLSSNECMHEMRQWEKIRNYTVQELSLVYNRLGVKFDEYAWESDYRCAKIMPLLQQMEQEGLLSVDSSGKKVMEVDGYENPVTLVKSDGTTLYLTRDVACALERYRRLNFKQMLYVVDNSQSNHFTALFYILGKLGVAPSEEEQSLATLKHVKFGRVRGMSTRKGTSVFLQDILDEAQAIMKEKILNSPNTKISKEMINETADVLGTSAVIVNDLKQRRQREYDFEWSHILQVEGDSGIRLQYTHSRLCNLEKNCGVEIPLQCDPLLLPEPEVTNLVREMARFEEVMFKSYNELEACHLVVYLFQLCNHINKAFKVLQVKDQVDKTGGQRLLLFHASRLILNQGMKTLGLKPLESM
ncbi:probable arginine--tRNA ligase, mitochondrial [Ischnura elegans]|uniref:probable arginine--tRNA ligase, mitochondrial n=1 Tax=Ischnura elegans TaxID=197161 RepID=UPI001ED87613|nr:probable arginine--tRNA ligase, mitochondrial [Ischnura elegans]